MELWVVGLQKPPDFMTSGPVAPALLSVLARIRRWGHPGGSPLSGNLRGGAPARRKHHRDPYKSLRGGFTSLNSLTMSLLWALRAPYPTPPLRVPMKAGLRTSKTWRRVTTQAPVVLAFHTCIPEITIRAQQPWLGILIACTLSSQSSQSSPK